VVMGKQVKVHMAMITFKGALVNSGSNLSVYAFFMPVYLEVVIL